MDGYFGHLSCFIQDREPKHSHETQLDTHEEKESSNPVILAGWEFKPCRTKLIVVVHTKQGATTGTLYFIQYFFLYECVGPNISLIS